MALSPTNHSRLALTNGAATSKTPVLVRAIGLTLRFLGQRTLMWLCVGIGCALLASFVEAGIMVFLQLFLKDLGMAVPVAAGSASAEWILRLNPTHRQLVGFLMVIGLARGFCQFLLSQSVVVAGESLSARLRVSLIFQMLVGRHSEYMPASEVNLKFSEIFPKCSRFSESLVFFVAYSITCMALVALMLLTAPREALVGLAGLSVVGLLVLKVNRTVGMTARRLPAQQEGILLGTDRIARNWLLVRILRTAHSEYVKLYNFIAEYSASTMRVSFITYASAALPPTLGVMLIVVIISLHLHFWNENQAQFLGFLYLFMRFSQFISSIVANGGNLVANFPQFRAGARFFLGIPRDDAQKAIEPLRHIAIRGVMKPGARLSDSDLTRSKKDANIIIPPPDLRILHVSFAYSPDLPLVIRSLSLDIPAGSQFGIVGKSGTGKSTLLGLILGIFTPTEGSITLAGQVPGDYLSKENMRVGYVGTEPFLIAGSIADNLTYGARAELSADDCWQALEQARIADTVRGLPGQLAFRLSESGEGLSAGQKQRLSLARALIGTPPLIVLDEASSNLDDATEASIAESIRNLKGKSTVIIVSHRKGILKYADSVHDFGSNKT